MENTQKYAYAEVISSEGTENWMLPVLAENEAKPAKTKVQKATATELDKQNTSKPWAEPRIAFADLLSWLDTNIWHKRCVFAKAAVTVGLGWRLVTDDDDKTEDAAFAAITEFLDKPNEDEADTFGLIAFKSLVDFEAVGNMFTEVSRSMNGLPGNMYHVRAANFRRSNKRNGGFFQVPKTMYNGSKAIPFARWGNKVGPLNEILHFYEYDPVSDFYGMPIWVPALADMVLDRSSVEFNISLFRNQLVAKFAVVVEGGKLDKDSRNMLQRFLASQAQGIQNAGRTLVLSSDDNNVKFKIEKLEMDFGDKQNFMGKTREMSRDMIVSAHGVPPRIVGIVSAGQLGGGSEAYEQVRIFEEIDRAPVRNRIETFFNRTLLAAFGDHKWKIQFNGIDTTDKKLDAEVEQILKQAGIKLVEESRESLNLPALPEDELNRLSQGATTEATVNELVQLRKRLESGGV